MKRASEQDIAAVLVNFLSSDGWDVYQEVPSRDGAAADIVAVRDGCVMVVEVKTTFGLRVMEQAALWRGAAHYVCVFVPGRPNRFGEGLLRGLGIGAYALIGDGEVVMAVTPRLDRAAHASATRLRSRLAPQHKTAALAGTNGGGRWTPFRATCEALKLEVARHPEGIKPKLAVAGLKHHYRSDALAATSMARWALKGMVPGVVVRKVENRVLLFPGGA